MRFDNSSNNKNTSNVLKVSSESLLTKLHKLEKTYTTTRYGSLQSSKNLKEYDLDIATKNSPTTKPTAKLRLFRAFLAFALVHLLIIGLINVKSLNAQTSSNNSSRATSENIVLWNYDALANKMEGDIVKAALEGRFQGKIALVSLTLFEGTFDDIEERYLLNILERLDYSSRLYYFVRSIEELSRTRVNRDGELVKNVVLPEKVMTTLAEKLDADFFAQVGIVKKGRRLQLSITIFETASSTAVWSKTWSVLRDEKRNFIQLNISSTIDNLYTTDFTVYSGRNILNIGHFGIELGVNYSFLDAKYPLLANSHVQPGVRIGAVLAFSLVQSIIDNFTVVDLFFQVRPGFNIAYQVSRKYSPIPEEESKIKNALSFPIGFSLLIKDFFIINTEIDVAHLLSSRRVPLGLVPVISLGFKF